MENHLYVMLLKRGKTYNKMTKAVVQRHVENIRNWDDFGLLALCGAFKGYPGTAGMLIFKTESYEAAEALCKSEPLVVEGYATYELHRLMVANKENNYLMP